MSETSSEPPLWMLQLENRQKRHHRLAHEIGAGAPCLKCVDSCPGLDLHFWRKTCRNCRCRKEDHEVTDDNCFFQFDILLSSEEKTHKRVFKKAILDLNIAALDSAIKAKQLHDSDVEKKKVTLDWVPPGIPLELAAEYMQKLPSAKLPITGSSGALYRKQQFEKQLPPHDLAVTLCHELSSNEVDEFNKYLDNIKTHVVGQGKVEKLIIPQTQMAEVTNQNLQKPQWSSNLKNVNYSGTKPYDNFSSSNPSMGDQLPASVPRSVSPKFSLKSPSDFIAANARLRNATANNLNFNNNNIYNRVESGANSLENQSDSTCNMNNDNRTISQNPCNAITDTVTAEKHFAQSSPIHGQKLPYQSERFTPMSKPLDASGTFSNFDVLPGSAIENQYRTDLEPQRMLNALKITDPKQNLYVEHSDALTRQTPVLSEQLKNKFGGNPINDLKESDVQINPATIDEDKDMISNHNQPSGLHCQQCDGEIFQGEVVVSIDRSKKIVYWHPQCFVCTCCQELLVDLVYFFHKDKVYCGRHYSEIVNIPRCFACDELIFVKQYTVAEGHNFHIRHFCCWECDVPLAEKSYIPVDDHPVCIECYNKLFGKMCLTCDNLVAPTDKRVSIKEMHWHATDSCFCCAFCKRSLLQSKMVIDRQKPFCNRNCALSLQ